MDGIRLTWGSGGLTKVLVIDEVDRNLNAEDFRNGYVVFHACWTCDGSFSTKDWKQFEEAAKNGMLRAILLRKGKPVSGEIGVELRAVGSGA